MNRIDRIKNEPKLKKFLCNECKENNVSVDFDDKIDKYKEVAIIKVDNFYSNQHLKKTPPAPDCLIVLKCKKSGYSLTIVELKNISSSKHLDLNNLLSKFRNCIDDFIKIRFRNLLYIDYKRIKLFFISNIEIHKRDLGLTMDLLTKERFFYKKQQVMIDIRKPIPLIKQCY